MEMLPAKIRDENCAARYSRELRNQNGKHLVNLYESNLWDTSHSELARTFVQII